MEAIEDLVVGKQECLGGMVDKSALKACSDEVEVQYVVFWLELIEKVSEEGKAYVEDNSSENELRNNILEVFMEVFYHFKREVFYLMGIEKEARAIGLL